MIEYLKMERSEPVMMQYPRLLIISNECLSSVSSNGRTLRNLLIGWPKEKLAQFHIRRTAPDHSVCDRFDGTGRVPKDVAESIGLVGVARRASVELNGDVMSRAIIRRTERIIDKILSHIFVFINLSSYISFEFKNTITSAF